MTKEHHWARLLAYVTGLVNQELLLQNEYLAAENRILRAHQPARLRLTDPEGETLARLADAWVERRWPMSLHCKTRYDSGLVSPTDRGKV
jgi:hypothetical protein